MQAIQDTIQTALEHHNAGRLPQAEVLYRQILQADPKQPDALHLLGLIAHRGGRNEEASRLIRQALAINPDSSLLHFNLGIVYQALGNADDAIACYRQVLALTPNNEQAYNNLGDAFKDTGHITAAIEHYRQAIALKADYAEPYINLARVLEEQGQLDAAAELCGKALALKPDSVVTHNNLGNVYRSQGKLDMAAESYRRALALEPDYALAHRNLGSVLHEQGELDAAFVSYRRAIDLEPDSPDALYRLAVLQLSVPDFANGWKGFEHRWDQTRDVAPRRPYAQPLWTGQALQGKAILLWGEQGIGDEILFAGMFPEVIAAAERCVIECAPKLVPLFTCSFPDATVVAKSNPPHRAAIEGIAYQCPAGSLPRLLRTKLEEFPAPNSFIKADPTRVAYWKERLADLGPGPKIGFAWRSRNMTGSRKLYYSTLDQWGAIFALHGVHFVNLQYDQCEAELEAARLRFGVPLHAFPEVDLFDDLAEAAALTKALDLVISASSTVPVLSAGLGVPTWMMNYNLTWESLGTGQMPWLPAVRSFNRHWDQRWDEIVEKIARDIASYSTNSMPYELRSSQ